MDPGHILLKRPPLHPQNMPAVAHSFGTPKCGWPDRCWYIPSASSGSPGKHPKRSEFRRLLLADPSAQSPDCPCRSPVLNAAQCGGHIRFLLQTLTQTPLYTALPTVRLLMSPQLVLLKNPGDLEGNGRLPVPGRKAQLTAPLKRSTHATPSWTGRGVLLTAEECVIQLILACF